MSGKPRGASKKSDRLSYLDAAATPKGAPPAHRVTKPESST
jgi:hypothetical protein